MPRAADQPGTFRVSDKAGADGKFRLSGVREDGSRLKMRVSSLTEGYTLGQQLFAGIRHDPKPVVLPTVGTAAAPTLDDFGLPVDWKMPEASAETIETTAPKLPPPTPGAVPTPTAPPPDAAEKRKNAESLAQIFGMGYTAIVVRKSTAFLEDRYETVPKTDPKTARSLADNFKKGITDTFGDREVGPWTMVILLTIGIPLTMWIQASGPKKMEEKKPPHLQSV